MVAPPRRGDMSNISFYNMHRQEAARVSGAERNHAWRLCADMFIASLDLHIISLSGDRSIFQCVDEKTLGDLRATKTITEAIDLLALRIRIDEVVFSYNDGGIVLTQNATASALNTALEIGSDPIKLLARLHGQCEQHLFVEDKNRDWLGEIIQRGMSANIMRHSMGWDDVITLLMTRHLYPGPVVISYSGTAGFPDSEIIESIGDSEEESEAFYALSDNEQWRLSMDALRKRQWLELKPENWNEFLFDYGITGFKLRSTVSAY